MSLSVPLLRAEQVDRVDQWLRSILWNNQLPGADSKSNSPLEIHRLKARLVLQNGDVKMIQGVREVFDIFDGERIDDQNDQGSIVGKIVLIGRGVKEADLEGSFSKAIDSA